MKSTSYNCGACEICNTPLQEKLIKQDFWIRDELIIVEDIPAGVCPQCGEKIVKAEVRRWVTELIKNSDRIAKAPRVSVSSSILIENNLPPILSPIGAIYCFCVSCDGPPEPWSYV